MEISNEETRKDLEAFMRLLVESYSKKRYYGMKTWIEEIDKLLVNEIKIDLSKK